MRNWEACYLAGDTPWDKGRAAPPLQEVLDRCGMDIWGHGTVLVPGCGMGHDVRALAAQGLPVLGLDISPAAVASARTFTPAGAEAYACGDFLDPAWHAGRDCSAVWEHTCFCAIDPGLRDAYAAAAARLLTPGGVLAGVFYLTPNDPGEEGPDPPFNVSIAELDQRFAPWFERLNGWVPQHAYPGREGREWVGIYRKLPPGHGHPI